MAVQPEDLATRLNQLLSAEVDLLEDHSLALALSHTQTTQLSGEGFHAGGERCWGGWLDYDFAGLPGNSVEHLGSSCGDGNNWSDTDRQLCDYS